MNKLKFLRLKRGLTQTQVAEQCNMSLREYQHIEHGEKFPRVDRAILIAKVLNVSVEFLFSQSEQRKWINVQK